MDTMGYGEEPSSQSLGRGWGGSECPRDEELGNGRPARQGNDLVEL